MTFQPSMHSQDYQGFLSAVVGGDSDSVLSTILEYKYAILISLPVMVVGINLLLDKLGAHKVGL